MDESTFKYLRQLEDKISRLQSRLDHLENQENAGQTISGNFSNVLVGSVTFRGSSYPTFLIIRDTNAVTGGVNVMRMLVITTGDMIDGLQTGFRIGIQDNAAGPNDIVSYNGRRNGGDALGKAIIGVRGPQDTGPNDLSTAIEIDYNGQMAYVFRGDNTNGFSWFDSVKYLQNSDVTVASTVAETTLASSGLGSLVFPANYFYAVRSILVEACGVVSTTGTPTLRLRFKFGSSSLIDTGAVTMPAGITNEAWSLRALITCRSVGAAGTFKGQGRFDHATATAGASNTGTTTIDTTAAQTANLTAEWGTSSASNTITCSNLAIRVLS